MHKKRLLALFTILCVCEAMEGRKELSNYWRSVMKDKDMPEAIKGLVVMDDEKKLQTGFVREFETRPNLILYHSRLDRHPKTKGPPEKHRKTEPGI